jgi:hypothetical protein
MAETTYNPDSLPEPPNNEMMDVFTSTLGSQYQIEGGATSKAENDVVVLISEKVSWRLGVKYRQFVVRATPISLSRTEDLPFGTTDVNSHPHPPH